ESGTPEPRLRPTAYGAAWFVDEVVSAPTAQSEMEFLGQVDLRRVAVVNGKDNGRLATPMGEMAEAEIVLEEYRPNYLRYRTSAPTEGVAVFSEIYYDKGWKAYIDGVEADYVRADYVLRAMNVPEGVHTIEWRFKAPAWSLVEGITLVASLLILLGALAVVVWEIRRLCKQ
ncbi:MAG: YfhO family protein, partial [Alistipes sp.]|nr:YfhO family protein [Alistipes sp.]